MPEGSVLFDFKIINHAVSQNTTGYIKYPRSSTNCVSDTYDKKSHSNDIPGIIFSAPVLQTIIYMHRFKYMNSITEGKIKHV